MKTKIYTLNAPDGEIRYAGKTSKTLEHRLQEHLAETCRGAKNHRCNWIRSLVEKNESPIIHLLAEVEGNGSKEEIKTIANFRAQGIRLTNQTDGGEGMSGWHPSPETLKKQSKAQKGSKNHNWRGGITPKSIRVRHSIETRLWRESVFARDNYTCQKTGKRGGKLVSHHIKNFAQWPELRFAIDNGITLSVKAHNEFHKKYGYKDNNKEQLIGFLDTMTKQIGGGKAPAPVAPMPAGAIE